MAIDSFWINLANAASHYRSPVVSDAQQIESGRLWLTPRSVDGYDADDFRFLDEPEQTALRESVEEFRAVVKQIPANKPATRQHLDEGRAAFGEILRLLRPDRFWEAEAFRTQVLMERELAGKLPQWVTGMSCELGTDSVGDPAVWIWIDVTDAAVDRGRIQKQGQALHDVIEDAYRRIGGKRWPFVRFRSPDAFARKQESA